MRRMKEKETRSHHRFQLSEWMADGREKEDGRGEHGLIWMMEGAWEKMMRRFEVQTRKFNYVQIRNKLNSQVLVPLTPESPLCLEEDEYTEAS